MLPFLFERVESSQDAVMKASVPADAHVRSPVQYLAGGTTLIDLMKLDVMRPEKLIDIKSLSNPSLHRIEVSDQGVRLGALVSMAEAADHPQIRKLYPVLSDGLHLAASAQLRNMASLSGNVLQRTRCSYFRDVSYTQCNKRNPGSGCAALGGENRQHGILGVTDACIATYPGDWAQSLMVLDAKVEILGRSGSRTIAFADLHREWGNTPHIETNLQPGELITAFMIPAGPHTKRSLYLKIRDRDSYQFALTSVAVALDLDGDRAKDVRIALGGVASKPWRAKDAEQVLIGQPINEATAMRAAQAAFANAKAQKHNAFKIKLGQETVVRALLQARAMEV